MPHIHHTVAGRAKIVAHSGGGALPEAIRNPQVRPGILAQMGPEDQMENAKELNRRVFQRWLGSRQEILKDTSWRSLNPESSPSTREGRLWHPAEAIAHSQVTTT